MVLRWVANPDLHQPRFVKRRVDKILLVASANVWSYASSDVNSADVGTREHISSKNLIDLLRGSMDPIFFGRRLATLPPLCSGTQIVCQPSSMGVRFGSCRLGFDSESGQTNGFKIVIHSFSA